MIKIILLFCLSFNLLYSLTLDEDKKYSFNNEIQYVEDKDNNLEFNNLKNLKYSNNNIINFGIVDSAYWFVLDVNLTQNAKKKDWYLKIEYPLLDKVDIYISDQNNTLHYVDGDMIDASKKQFKNKDILFKLNFSDSSAQQIVLKVKTSGSLQLPCYIMDSTTLMEDSAISYIMQGFYFGILFIIIFYNLVLYYKTLEKQYIFYISFVFSFSLWQLLLNGIGSTYIWSDFEIITQYGALYFMQFSIIFSVLFSKYFLDISNNMKSIEKYIDMYVVLNLFIFVLIFLLEYKYMVQIIIFISFITMLVIFILGVARYMQGEKAALYFSLGWLSFLLANLLFSLHKFGLIDGFDILTSAQQIGSAFEMIFLSWSISYKLAESKKMYLEKIENNNVVLKDEIESAINDARAKDDMIISQSRLAALGEMIEQIAHQWRQPLNTISLLNQDIYFKSQLSTLKTEDIEKLHTKVDESVAYMSNTINDLREYHLGDTAQVPVAIEDVIRVSISLNEAVLKFSNILVKCECGETNLISANKNELVQVFMNIIKNSIDAIKSNDIKKPIISISSHLIDKEIFIEIEDNAGGIDDKIMHKIFDSYFSTKKAEFGSGIGLYMSKSIIERNADGEIDVENTEHGAKFTIKFKSL